jgi:DNA-binding NarL/FixJ family response regulator
LAIGVRVATQIGPSAQPVLLAPAASLAVGSIVRRGLSGLMEYASRATEVLVIDDEMLVRAGLRVVLEADDAFRVAGEAVDADSAIRLASQVPNALAIVAVRLAGGTGPELTQRLRAAAPGLRIVLRGRTEDAQLLLDGLRAGAIGVIRSDVDRAELVAALRRAAAGESVVDPVVATALFVRLAADSDRSVRSLPERLTAREVEILQLMAEGQTNREIATRLIVAVGTIKAHVEHILGKLGVADRTQAAVRGVELGLLGAVVQSASHGVDREE